MVRRSERMQVNTWLLPLARNAYRLNEKLWHGDNSSPTLEIFFFFSWFARLGEIFWDWVPVYLFSWGGCLQRTRVRVGDV